MKATILDTHGRWHLAFSFEWKSIQLQHHPMYFPVFKHPRSRIITFNGIIFPAKYVMPLKCWVEIHETSKPKIRCFLESMPHCKEVIHKSYNCYHLPLTLSACVIIQRSEVAKNLLCCLYYKFCEFCPRYIKPFRWKSNMSWWFSTPE